MTEPKLPRSLAPDELRRRCNPQELGFRTTDDLEDPLHIVGQSRAVDAIRFAVGIDREGYNMFAAGPSGTGKHSTLRQFLEGRATKMETPPDVCYVHNFENPHRPNMILLPAGKGAPFRRDMAQLVELEQAAIPRAFEGEEYRTRRRELDARFHAAHDRIFADVQREATEKSIAILRTPAGLALAPIRDGEIVSPEDFSKWPEDEQEKTRQIITELQEKLHAAMVELPAFERDVRTQLRELNRGVNEKIEGFFDVCSQAGLTGDQGVMIPVSNVQHLMLRHDVVEAVRAGRFHIHAVATIDEGIALLTGMAAGERGADGKFAEGTINARVEARLAGFAESARHFARSAAPDDGDHRRH